MNTTPAPTIGQTVYGFTPFATEISTATITAVGSYTNSLTGETVTWNKTDGRFVLDGAYGFATADEAEAARQAFQPMTGAEIEAFVGRGATSYKGD